MRGAQKERTDENGRISMRTIEKSADFFVLFKHIEIFRIARRLLFAPDGVQFAGSRVVQTFTDAERARRGSMAETQGKKMGLVQWILIGIVVAGGLYMFLAR
jgi:hypothetical protein